MLLGITMTGCKKSPREPAEPPLPDITQDGRNVVACRISDGRRFIALGEYDAPFGFSFACHEGCYEASYSYSTSFYASSCEDDYAVELNVSFPYDSLQPGNYNFRQWAVGRASLEWTTRNDDGSRKQQLYSTDSLLTGTVFVTRSDDSVYAGTFDLTLRNYFDSTQTLRLTDGRFDISRR